MKSTTVPPVENEAGSEETEEKQADRTYGCANAKTAFEFDPTADLNLPASYDEVLARFRKLQGSRNPGALN